MLQSNVSNPLVAIASHLPLPGLLASYPHIIGHSFLSRLQLNGALSVLLKAAPNVTLNFIRNDDSSDLSGWTLERMQSFSPRAVGHTSPLMPLSARRPARTAAALSAEAE